MLLRDLLELPSVMDGGIDLPPVPDDTLVPEEALNVLLAVGSDLTDVEAVEGCLEIGPLIGDGLPAEACLEDAAGEVLKVGVVVRGLVLPVHPAGRCPLLAHILLFNFHRL
ncbi:MAG: hypothetical protein PVJ38_01855 [Candidatus Bathyarchaeota archaeon]|jgi:hypothetical protein